MGGRSGFQQDHCETVLIGYRALVGSIQRDRSAGELEAAASDNIRAMTLEELRTTSRDEIMRLAADCGAANVRIFGSVARGENDSRSDVDLLVDLEPGRSLLDLARLQRKLEQLLTVRVDVVSARGLRDGVRETVLRDALPL
jgi:predicted nucleotidyltransferase